MLSISHMPFPKNSASAGPCVRRRLADRRTSALVDAGVTLFELLMVLAIMSLTIVASAASIEGSGGAIHLQPLAVRVAADLKLARAETTGLSRPVEVAFDAKAHAYRVAGVRAAVILPPTIAFKLSTSEKFRRTADGAQLVFLADGSSTGGELPLSDGRQSITLAVDWLTGSVVARRSAQ